MLPGTAAAAAEPKPVANLLRNSEFQDDWITLLPENKNHHWCYSTEFFNRRDHNPDAWICRGSWDWLDADAPAGRRRLVLRGPAAELTQRVNWVAVHDDRSLAGFPDAGGFPDLRPQHSPQPLRLVRDVTLRVYLKGQDVPAGAASIEVGFCPPGTVVASDPMGSLVPPTTSASASVPSGTFEEHALEVTLKAEAWLQAVKAGPEDRDARLGPVLPGTVQVAIRYKAAAGSIEVVRAELFEATGRASGPSLIANGGFEAIGPEGYPRNWSAPEKYGYFPPRLYYLMNTWHNGSSANRGPVAAEALVAHAGARSLKMIVAAGDEVAVLSDPITLNQREPRLLEVHARVKTDSLCTLQLDAVDDRGRRLDGFNFLHKAPVSIGTEDWRVIRQVFRPREPVRSVRLMLCARGSNGYTLDDTGQQPQNNVVGTIWWDDLELTEPESTPDDLAARGALPGASAEAPSPAGPDPQLLNLDLGERLLGRNQLGAVITNPGPPRTFRLRWEFTSPSGRTSTFRSAPRTVPSGGREAVRMAYDLDETCPAAYTEFRGTLTLLEEASGKQIASTALWFGTWTTPVDLELGALYLAPGQHLFVRMNLGLTAARVATLGQARIELVRRGTGEILKDWTIAEVPRRIAELRSQIPAELREDFRNLLLARLDVAFLPLQPFDDPQRNWFVRVRVSDRDGREVAQARSADFCRQAHDRSPQPAISSVTIRDDLVHINGRPWMPWGAIYGFVPVHAGPEGPGPVGFRDLHNVPDWSIYDRFTAEPYNRRDNDFNCLRYVAGSITDPAVVTNHWDEDNLYAASVFAAPQPVFSLDDLAKQAGGRAAQEAYERFCRGAPMVVSVAPGIEEAFGLFQGTTQAQRQGLQGVVARLRSATGKPVMVSHGGAWNRLEFEKVPFFDIYDPETEPLAPAELHTDLRPLVAGRGQVIWLRPQMYEDVPFERWRFHTYVELMRGCRGWQIAHGPGDASLFRGLHGELEFFRPIVASPEPGPGVTLSPPIEHWSRRHDGRLYVLAATTRGIPFGAWRRLHEPGSPAGDFTRQTASPAGRPAGVHGVQYLPDARKWPRGTRLVQWVRLDPSAPPKNLVILLKGDGRWTHALGWGGLASLGLRTDPRSDDWFLRSFYRHADGFLGWDQALVPSAREYVPEVVPAGALPGPGRWTRLEVPLEQIGAEETLLDGIGFLHQEGRVVWGRTSLIGPDRAGAGREGETVVWGNSLAIAPERLARVRVGVPGLKPGTRIRVLFEDRERIAEDGAFLDDFRGQDLYQRYGGEATGYGREPVAVHAYEIPGV
jgi:hypothetical protein